MLVQTIVELQIVLLDTHADILSKYLPKEKQCLELFARNLLPGWTSWGNEVMWHAYPQKHCYWSVLALNFLRMILCYQLKIGMFHQHFDKWLESLSKSKGRIICTDQHCRSKVGKDIKERCHYSNGVGYNLEPLSIAAWISNPYCHNIANNRTILKMAQ